MNPIKDGGVQAWTNPRGDHVIVPSAFHTFLKMLADQAKTLGVDHFFIESSDQSATTGVTIIAPSPWMALEFSTGEQLFRVQIAPGNRKPQEIVQALHALVTETLGMPVHSYIGHVGDLVRDLMRSLPEWQQLERQRSAAETELAELRARVQKPAEFSSFQMMESVGRLRIEQATIRQEITGGNNDPALVTELDLLERSIQMFEFISFILSGRTPAEALSMLLPRTVECHFEPTMEATVSELFKQIPTAAIDRLKSEPPCVFFPGTQGIAARRGWVTSGLAAKMAKKGVSAWSVIVTVVTAPSTNRAQTLEEHLRTVTSNKVRTMALRILNGLIQDEILVNDQLNTEALAIFAKTLPTYRPRGASRSRTVRHGRKPAGPASAEIYASLGDTPYWNLLDPKKYKEKLSDWKRGGVFERLRTVTAKAVLEAAAEYRDRTKGIAALFALFSPHYERRNHATLMARQVYDILVTTKIITPKGISAEALTRVIQHKTGG